MKKKQVDHVLRAAGKIVKDDQFIIIGSQSLHGTFPDLPDCPQRPQLLLPWVRPAGFPIVDGQSRHADELPVISSGETDSLTLRLHRAS